jgi:hypothetical protein
MSLVNDALEYLSDESVLVGYDEDDEELARYAKGEWEVAESIDDLPGEGELHTKQMILPPTVNGGEIIRHPNRYKFNFHRRTAAERERDRTVVAKLYLEGRSQTEIAKAIKEANGDSYQLSIPTISRDIQLLLRDWQLTYLSDINKAKVRELVKLDHAESELWEAWAASKQDVVETQQTTILGRNDRDPDEDKIEAAINKVPDHEGIQFKQGGLLSKKVQPEAGQAGSQSRGKGFVRTKFYEKRRSTYGDIRIIEQIRLIIEMRAKILGLITTKSAVDVSWRKEAEKAGLDPDEIYDTMTESFLQRGMKLGDDER